MTIEDVTLTRSQDDRVTCWLRKEREIALGLIRDGLEYDSAVASEELVNIFNLSFGIDLEACWAIEKEVARGLDHPAEFDPYGLNYNVEDSDSSTILEFTLA